MYSFLDILFWFFAVFFVVVSFFSFFIPGYFFVSRFKNYSSIISLVLSIVLGVVIWGALGYILGYIGLRFLTYFYLLLSIFWSIKNRKELKNFFTSVWKEIKSLDKIVVGLVAIGLVLQILPMIASGMRFGDGVRFYFVNEADGVMHLAYIQSIIRSFPPMEPGAVGLPLVNYHYWSDLVIAEMSRIFFIPVAHLFFQYIPVLFFFVTSLAVISVIKIWKGSLAVTRWALFLLYFSGDAAYIIYFLLHQEISFHTPAIDNGVTQFFNMPHVFAKMIFFTSLVPLHLWITTKKKEWGILSIVLFTSLFGFKVYYGLFAALGFSFIVAGKFLSSYYTGLRKKISLKTFLNPFKEHKFSFLLLGIFAFLAALIYFPTNKGAGGLFFSPLEWPKLLLGEQALNFREWWLRMQVYEAAGNTRNIIIYNIIAVLIALISIYGTRLLGFWPNKKIFKELRMEGFLFLVPGVLIFTFLGFFTLQESGLFNIFNFFVVSLVVLSLFTAINLGDLSQKKNIWAKIFLVIFVLITLPRVINETTGIVSAYVNGKYRLISNDELEALEYIRTQTPEGAIIQSHPKNDLDMITPYTSFFAQRYTYFTGGGLLATHNQPIDERQEKLDLLFAQPNANEFAHNLKELEISYVYIQKKGNEPLELIDGSPNLEVVFENKGVIIYKYVQ